jgi:hypothetical protein
MSSKHFRAALPDADVDLVGVQAAKRWGVTYLAELHEIHMEHHLEKFPASNFYGTAAGFAMMYVLWRWRLRGWVVKDDREMSGFCAYTD